MCSSFGFFVVPSYYDRLSMFYVDAGESETVSRDCVWEVSEVWFLVVCIGDVVSFVVVGFSTVAVR